MAVELLEQLARASTVTVYPITNLTTGQARPADLAGWLRGHWLIESLHHIRDVSFGEDASQVRIGNAPHALAALRNLVISLFRLTGVTNIAKALRHNSRNLHRPHNYSESPETDESLPCRGPGVRPRWLRRPWPVRRGR